jgi:hypothetical protein
MSAKNATKAKEPKPKDQSDSAIAYIQALNSAIAAYDKDTPKQ